MLHLWDPSQACAVALPPPGRRTLRLRVHLTCPDLVTGWDGVRALVIADVLLRALEMEGVQVFPSLALPDLPATETKRLDRLLSCYGVRRPEAEDEPHADVHVLTSTHASPSGSGLALRVGPTTVSVPAPPLPRDPTDQDAMARRCALLSAPYREPVTVTEAGLLDAATTLAGWRTRVAAWSLAPSRPVPAEIRDRARTMLGTDLDTPGLLGLLRSVADDPDLPDGARFEAFVFLDRMLGIELGRDVGRY